MKNSQLFKHLEVAKREILILLASTGPCPASDLRDVVADNVGGSFTYRDLFRHLNTLMESDLIAKFESSETTYTITDAGIEIIVIYYEDVKSDQIALPDQVDADLLEQCDRGRSSRIEVKNS